MDAIDVFFRVHRDHVIMKKRLWHSYSGVKMIVFEALYVVQSIII